MSFPLPRAIPPLQAMKEPAKATGLVSRKAKRSKSGAEEVPPIFFLRLHPQHPALPTPNSVALHPSLNFHPTIPIKALTAHILLIVQT